MIPKIIHYCWLSDDEFPDLINKCIKSWQKFLPEYEFIIWDRKKFDIQNNTWVKEAYNAHKYAFAADYIRFYALYNYGGIYLDADVQILKSFNDLLFNKSFIGLDSTGDFEAAIIGSEKGVPWIKKILDYYIGKKFIKNNGTYDITPLPLIIKNQLSSLYQKKISQKSILEIKDILNIYPCQYFSPKNFHTKKITPNKNTYCIHHFDGNWVKKSLMISLKEKMHYLILLIFGKKMHYSFVTFIRLLKKIK